MLAARTGEERGEPNDGYDANEASARCDGPRRLCDVIARCSVARRGSSAGGVERRPSSAMSVRRVLAA
jgi:hypothetical protein